MWQCVSLLHLASSCRQCCNPGLEADDYEARLVDRFFTMFPPWKLEAESWIMLDSNTSSIFDLLDRNQWANSPSITQDILIGIPNWCCKAPPQSSQHFGIKDYICLLYIRLCSNDGGWPTEDFSDKSLQVFPYKSWSIEFSSVLHDFDTFKLFRVLGKAFDYFFSFIFFMDFLVAVPFFCIFFGVFLPQKPPARLWKKSNLRIIRPSTKVWTWIHPSTRYWSWVLPRDSWSSVNRWPLHSCNSKHCTSRNDVRNASLCVFDCFWIFGWFFV